MNKLLSLGLLCTLIFLFSCTVEHQPLKVAQVFTDNMVLQANKAVNLWGTATPGSKVTVNVRKQQQTVKADKNGNWMAVLDAENYGDATTLKINTKDEAIELSNVLYGEVWLCSGQSNMEMPLISNWAKLDNAEQEVKNANYPNIRLFNVDNRLSFQPIDTISTVGWEICDSNSVKNFSATAYFFGRKLHKALNVPVGLIHSSWGGTVAEAWTSKESLLQTSDFAEQTALIAKQTGSLDSLKAKYEADLAQQLLEVQQADIGFDGATALFAQSDVDDSDWMPIDLPKMWEETDLGVFDGSGWFRKTVDIPAKMANNSLTLCFGAVDDWDEAWVNGVKIGATQQWGVLREYPIPANVIQPGKNQITIRVYDYGGGGGFMNEASDYRIDAANGKSISIAKGWVVKKGFDFKEIKTKPISLTDPNQPTVLYNAMINPLIPYTFQGAIWYQGESNAGRAHQYQSLFKTMINDWRNKFSNGDFPFYFVQLANYLQRNTDPVEDSWAELREAQTMALELPNTGMAVTIDIGNALDIHPGNKQDVGKRLALNALAKTYNKDINFMGPLYKSFTVNNKNIEIEFDYNEGLTTQDGKALTGFSIAGSDSVFMWADAKVEGNKVIVSNKNISSPIAVRYAWASNPACNLTNNTGIPASPFRTDDFKGITE